MDSMSYRNNRPSARPSEPEEQAQTAPPATSHVSVTTEHPAAKTKRSHGNSKPKLPLKLLVGLLVVVALVVAVVWFVVGRSTALGNVIDGNKYQAVFFTNGQAYFGKLSPVNNEYMRLKNVYYIQDKTKTPQSSESESSSSNAELIRLGSVEIHGPENEMIIAKDQILFFENLKSDGKVSQVITDYETKNKK